MRTEVDKALKLYNQGISQKEKQLIPIETKMINQFKKTKSILSKEYALYTNKKLKSTKITTSNLKKLQASKLPPEALQQIKRIVSPLEKQLEVIITQQNQLEQMIQKEIVREEISEKTEAEKQVKFNEYLLLMKGLRGEHEQKDKYLQIEYEKDMVAYQKDKERYSQIILELNMKIDKKEKKAQDMIESITLLRQELFEVKKSLQTQESVLSQSQQQNARYRSENTQIKLKNKNLTADNKVVLTHLDKLLNEKNKNEEVFPRQVFQERERKVIAALYHKNCVSQINNPEQLLPSSRNELSNKLKYQQMTEKYRELKAQTYRQIEMIDSKTRECEQQQRIIRNLERKIEIMGEIERKNQSSYEIAISTINKLEEQNQILKSKLNYMTQQQKQKYQYLYGDKQQPAYPFKTKIGSIVQKRTNHHSNCSTIY